MSRRIRNNDVQENSESESDDDDAYQEEDREESTTSTPSQSPSKSPSQSPSPTLSPSPAPASARPSSLPETPPPRRVTRSSTPKVGKAVATIIKTPKTPRTIVTRSRVIKKATEASRGDHPDVDIESVGDAQSEADPQLLTTPKTKKPRPRAKKGAAVGGEKTQPEGGTIESKGDVKSVKKPTSRKPRDKAKGRVAGDQPEEGGVDSEADTKPVKTPTPNRSRAKLEGSKAASERTKTPATPRKLRTPRPKKNVKASAAAATAPLIASIQDNDDGDRSSVGLPSRVSSPLNSPMDGIETYRSAAAVLQTYNWDCEMMAMPQQERNGGGQPHRHGYNTVSRYPTVLPEACHSVHLLLS